MDEAVGVAPMSETDLVQKCIRWVKDQGGTAYHVHGSAAQRAGEPDIDGAIPTSSGFKHFKIECKVGDNNPTKLQLYRLREYARLGYTTGVARSLDEFKEILQKGRELR